MLVLQLCVSLGSIRFCVCSHHFQLKSLKLSRLISSYWMSKVVKKRLKPTPILFKCDKVFNKNLATLPNSHLLHLPSRTACTTEFVLAAESNVNLPDHAPSRITSRYPTISAGKLVWMESSLLCTGPSPHNGSTAG